VEDPLSLLWLFVILASLQPAAQRSLLMAARRRQLAKLSRDREATVITLIHRQETMSLFGFPLVRYIDIDDAEGVLRAIRETPTGRPIEPELQVLGLPVRVGVPEDERELMKLYPQPRGRQSSVEYVPGPAERPGLPRGRDAPSPARGRR
jgi:hypothetical protein